MTSADRDGGASTRPGRPLLALAHLRNSDTYTRLAMGFEICPRRATAIVQAIPVLHHVEVNRYAG